MLEVMYEPTFPAKITDIIVGENSRSFNKFYVNGEEVSIENGIVDLTSMSGELNLKAISENGAVTTLIINK